MRLVLNWSLLLLLEMVLLNPCWNHCLRSLILLISLYFIILLFVCQYYFFVFFLLLLLFILRFLMKMLNLLSLRSFQTLLILILSNMSDIHLYESNNYQFHNDNTLMIHQFSLNKLYILYRRISLFLMICVAKNVLGNRNTLVYY